MDERPGNAALPPDDPHRRLAIASADRGTLPHIAVAGDTYTILLTGADTGGRYCLIDMHVPADGGPGPHRHDFEEMFSVLEGAVDFTLRGETTVATAGTTVNIPANAPHSFTNRSGEPARMLCLCSPPGQEEFFLAIGVPVAGRTTAPPVATEAQREQMMAKAKALAPRFKTELLQP